MRNLFDTIDFIRLDAQQESRFSLPQWTQGTWLSIDGNTFSINQTALSMKMSDDSRRFLRIIQSKHSHEYSVRLRVRSLEQW